MTLEEFNYIAEIVASVAVIASLIYVGLQVRQNTEATQVSTSQAFVSTHGEIVLQISREKEFTDIFYRGLSGLSNLDDSETVAFTAWAIHAFRAWESFYFQWQDGVLDDRLWPGWKTQFCDLFRNPGIREIWGARNHQLSEEFHEFVDQQIIAAESKPLHDSLVT